MQTASYIEVRLPTPLPFLENPSLGADVHWCEQTSRSKTSLSPRRATSKSSTLVSPTPSRPTLTSLPSAALSTLPLLNCSTPSHTLDQKWTFGVLASCSMFSFAAKCLLTIRACLHFTPKSSEALSNTPRGSAQVSSSQTKPIFRTTQC